MDALRSQQRYLDAARQDTEPDPVLRERLADLWESARRRRDEGRFDDAVARLYRLTEYIGQARLRLQGLKPKMFSEDLRRMAPIYFAQLPSWKGAGGIVKLAVRDNIEMLHELGDPVGVYLMSQYKRNVGDQDPTGPLCAALDARNQSFLGHGSNPVEEAIASLLLEFGEKPLRFTSSITKNPPPGPADRGTASAEQRDWKNSSPRHAFSAARGRFARIQLQATAHRRNPSDIRCPTLPNVI